MTKECPICGSPNDDELQFCESCGSPLGESTSTVEEPKAEEQEIPALKVKLGYASSQSEGPERKDSFLVVDTAALFGETKHRRILCVIVKGLSEVIDSRAITQDLIADVLRNQGEIDYSKHLLDIQNKMKMEFSSFFSSDTSEVLETGLLVGVIDNAQANVLCMDAPKVLVLKSNSEEVTEDNKDGELLNLSLGDNDCICMSCCNLLGLLQENEALEIVLKATDPQTACDELARKVKAENAEADFSLAVARITT